MDKDPRQLELDLQSPEESKNIHWFGSNGSNIWKPSVTTHTNTVPTNQWFYGYGCYLR